MRPHVVHWLEAMLPGGLASALAPTWFTCVGLAGIVTLFAMLAIARRHRIDAGAAASAVLWCYLAAVVAGIAVPSAIDAAAQLISTGRVEVRWAGMTSFWGYLAGGAAVAAVCRMHAVSLPRFADLTVAPLGVALALARLGCFVAGCDYGKVSALPWAVRFPAHSPAWQDHVNAGLIAADRAESLPVHPTQLYEAALGVVIALVAIIVARRRWARSNGRMFVLAAAIYAIGRLAVEDLRGDTGRGIYLGLSSGQIFALAVLAAIAAARWLRRIRPSAIPATATTTIAVTVIYALIASSADAQPTPPQPKPQQQQQQQQQPMPPQQQPKPQPQQQQQPMPPPPQPQQPKPQPQQPKPQQPPQQPKPQQQPPPQQPKPQPQQPKPQQPPPPPLYVPRVPGTAPAQAGPPQPMPGQPMPGQPMPGQPMPGQPMPGQPMPGQPMPGQPMPGQSMPGQPMPGQSMPGQPMPGQPMPGQSMPGQPMPGQPMPGQWPPGQVMPGQPTPGDESVDGGTAPRRGSSIEIGALAGAAAAFNRRRDQVPALAGASLSVGFELRQLGFWLDLDSLGNRDASHGTILMSGSAMFPVARQLAIGARVGLGATLVNFDDPAFRDVVGTTGRFEMMMELRLGESWSLWLRPLAIDVLTAPDLGGPIATWQTRIGLAYRIAVGRRGAPRSAATAARTAPALPDEPRASAGTAAATTGAVSSAAPGAAR